MSDEIVTATGKKVTVRRSIQCPSCISIMWNETQLRLELTNARLLRDRVSEIVDEENG